MSKDYSENGKTHNMIFRLYENGAMVPYRCKSKSFNIDSLEETLKMYPRIRGTKDTVASSLFNKPVEELLKYQAEVNSIKDCEPSERSLLIYIKEVGTVYEITIKNYGKCPNKIYQEKSSKLIDIMDRADTLLMNFSPG